MMGFTTTICRNRWQLSRVMEILVTRKSDDEKDLVGPSHVRCEEFWAVLSG